MNRAGAALILTLLVLFVLEGVVLGTVYVAVQEHRIAQNGVTALRLRLAAEAAARAAAGHWPAALDSLLPGMLTGETRATDADGLMVRSVYQRIDSALVLVFGEAAEQPPRAGRARAAVLIEPPLLPLERIPDSALTAGAAVRLGPRATLSTAFHRSCPDDSVRRPDALRMPADALLERAAGASVDGATAASALAADWTTTVARIAAALRPLADGLYRDTTSSAVIAVAGDLTIPAHTTWRGVVLVGGTLVIEAGAVVDGIVLAIGPIEVDGTIRFSFCAAHDAIRAARLHRPRAHAFRASIPAF